MKPADASLFLVAWPGTRGVDEVTFLVADTWTLSVEVVTRDALACGEHRSSGI